MVKRGEYVAIKSSFEKTRSTSPNSGIIYVSFSGPGFVFKRVFAFASPSLQSARTKKRLFGFNTRDVSFRKVARSFSLSEFEDVTSRATEKVPSVNGSVSPMLCFKYVTFLVDGAYVRAWESAVSEISIPVTSFVESSP